MASTYILKHPGSKSGANGTGAAPWIYFLAEKVTMPMTNQLLKMAHPDQSPNVRSRAPRERKISVMGVLPVGNAETGVQTTSGAPSGNGRDLLSYLEAAVFTWKASGSVALQLGTQSDGTTGRSYEGIIENITPDWHPAHADDEANEIRFTLTFIEATVT